MNPQQSDAGAAFDRRTIPAGAAETSWEALDGQRIRRFDWRETGTKCRGSLLFLPGRADFYEKYLETLAGWHAGSWRVTSIDWRGQALSGRLGDDPWTGHIDDFSTWVEDLAGFWADWAARTPAPRVIVAHSMGAHIVMRTLAAKLIDPDAVVLVAPMLGFVPASLPLSLSQSVAKVMTKALSPAHPAWKGSEKPGRVPEQREDLLTHDDARYEDELWWRTHRPGLATGAPSWGWLERAVASMRELARPGVLEEIRQQVLILATSEDKLVDFGAIRRAAKRMPNCRLRTFGKEARHEILRESDDIREIALAEIDAFLDGAAPAPI